MPERTPLKPFHFTAPNGIERFEVPSFGARMRLDTFLARYGESRSRSEWVRLIQSGAVTLDGRRVRPSDRIVPGQRVQYAPPELPQPKTLGHRGYDCAKVETQDALLYPDWQTWNLLAELAAIRARSGQAVLVVNWPVAH